MNGRLVLAGLLVCSVSLLAAAPPAVGDTAPDFKLPRALDGTEIRLSDAVASNKVVLVVLRGYPGYQCPFCNRQVHDLIANARLLRGLRVLLIYPGAAEGIEAKAKEFLADKSFPANFDLLVDPGYRVTSLYGLRWDKPGETAYPSTFALDLHGKVTFRKISRTHGDRTTAAEIAAAAGK